MPLDRCVDFRYVEGFPPLEKALRDGTRAVRCISLPEMETQARQFIQAGIRVFAVYTGESNNADSYIMRNCSALIIGNEPQFAMDGDASWPTGTADDYVNVYSHVANVLVPAQHAVDLPLLGAGIWCQDFAKWALVAKRLPRLSGATCHVYPGASSQSPGSVRTAVRNYRNVRPDLPLICGEWTARGDVLSYAQAIDTYCEMKFWYGPGLAGHELEGTPEYGILALTK